MTTGAADAGGGGGKGKGEGKRDVHDVLGGVAVGSHLRRMRPGRERRHAREEGESVVQKWRVRKWKCVAGMRGW